MTARCHACNTELVIIVDLPGVEETLARVERAMKRMEKLMATEAEQINALTVKMDDLIADVRAALAALAASRDQLGPDGQAALDVLTSKVDAFDAEVGDADGSDVAPTP